MFAQEIDQLQVTHLARTQCIVCTTKIFTNVSWTVTRTKLTVKMNILAKSLDEDFIEKSFLSSRVCSHSHFLHACHSFEWKCGFFGWFNWIFENHEYFCNGLVNNNSKVKLMHELALCVDCLNKMRIAHNYSTHTVRIDKPNAACKYLFKCCCSQCVCGCWNA